MPKFALSLLLFPPESRHQLTRGKELQLLAVKVKKDTVLRSLHFLVQLLLISFVF